MLPAAGIASGCILVVAAVLAGLASNNVAAERAEIDRIIGAESDLPLERRFAGGLREVYDTTLIQHIYARTADDSSAVRQAVLQTYIAAALADGGPKSLKLSISTANVLSGIVFTRPAFQARFGGQEMEFRTIMERLIRRAPRRSDIAIPYFNHLLAVGREPEVLNFANLILARHDDDPVALWFSGIVLLGTEGTGAAGMRNLRRSLTFGIRNLMPIDDALVQSIEQ
jgi:hypothetical protein